jgi:glycogen synthase
MQVYFLDNEDYFHRKFVFANDKNVFYNDNDERTIFFCKGALETVKKLGWQPDIIHCQGWMTSLIPLYIKKELIQYCKLNQNVKQKQKLLINYAKSKYNIDKIPVFVIIASTLNIIWMKRFNQKALRNIIELSLQVKTYSRKY